MTNQEVFTKVKNHLLKQGKRSTFSNNDTCLYRANELKCAIGCLIPDNLYSEEMERHPVYSLISRFVGVEELFKGVDVELLRELQSLHDAVSPIHWKMQLKSLATRIGLKYE